MDNNKRKYKQKQNETKFNCFQESRHSYYETFMINLEPTKKSNFTAAVEFICHLATHIRFIFLLLENKQLR